MSQLFYIINKSNQIPKPKEAGQNFINACKILARKYAPVKNTFLKW
jgi:hypothetical protein